MRPPNAIAPRTGDPGLRAFVVRMLVALALVALALGLWRLREVLLLAFAAVLVAVVLDAIAGVGRHRLGLPRGAALALAVALVLGALGATLWLFGAEVRDQVRSLGESLPQAWGELRRRVEETLPGLATDGRLEEALPDGSAVLSIAQGALVSLGGGIADALLVVVGGVYLAAAPELYRRGLLKLLPASRRALVDEALGDCGRALRKWLLGQSVSMAIVAVLTTLGLWWVGLPSAVALGVVAGLLDFVPVVGPVVAAVPALLLALAQDTTTALWTLAVYVVVQQVEGNVVQPLVQQRAVDLPAALLLFAILAAGLLFGGPGVVLAAPLAVVVYVLVKRLYVREALDTPTPVPGEERGSRG